MRRDCHVLLICDDELAAHELKRALGAELVVSQTLEGLTQVTFDLRFEPVVLGAAWEIDLRDKRYDLCVVSVRGDSPARFLSAEALNRDRVGSTLFLIDGALEARGQW